MSAVNATIRAPMIAKVTRRILLTLILYLVESFRDVVLRNSHAELVQGEGRRGLDK